MRLTKEILSERIPDISRIQSRKRRKLLQAGLASLLFLILINSPLMKQDTHPDPVEVEAADWMARATVAIRDELNNRGFDVNRLEDPNDTGFIGPEMSGLTTTVGDAAAKRSSTNPAMASLIVRLLRRCQVEKNDTIAIASSGSFPALLIATLAAARAMNLKPVTILSLGASTYGATRPRFNLLDIYTVGQNIDLVDRPPAAVSLGGTKDMGLEFDTDTKEGLINQILEAKLPLILTSDPARNITMRLEAYRGQAESNIKVLLNIGGSEAALGSSPAILKLKPGINRNIQSPGGTTPGLIHEMAAEGIPVIHLLFLKGLTLKFGLAWDPVPLPQPGSGPWLASPRSKKWIFWLQASVYFLLLLFIATGGNPAAYIKKRRSN